MLIASAANPGMISCPTCRRKAEPKARFCPACYTVFPSDTLEKRRLAATRNRSSSWKGFTLFFTVATGLWFWQIDAEERIDDSAYQASARAAKRQMLDWIGQSTEAAKEAVGISPGDVPAALLRNDDRLPCARGRLCEVSIRFGSGRSAKSFIERPHGGDARLFAVDEAGKALMRDARRAEVIDPASGAKTPIVRNADNLWTVADGAQISVTNSDYTKPGGGDEL